MVNIYLKRQRERAVERQHPWIFSGAISKMEGTPADGELVRVHGAKGNYLATGHYQEGSIMVRIISFEEGPIDQAFWNQKIEQALRVRKQLGLWDHPPTNCFRLVHAEGDGLPGLIIDYYNDTAVVQCHSIGMHLHRNQIAEALKQVFGERLKAIYDKSAQTLPERVGQELEDTYLYGEASDGIVLEHGHSFKVDWQQGQKTGFFLDQRYNRALLAQYASGKSVLNTFSYSGGFSIYALKAGATKVVSVDVSGKAIEWVEENVRLNGFAEAQHEAVKSDVLQYFQSTEELYDIVVVDPPAFAKNLRRRHNAVMGYKRLNAAALEKVKSGGLLFTFSCSQVIDRELFYNTIVAAGQEQRRPIRVLHHLTQPPDHPVSLFHPEGSYLKGLVLQVG